MVVKTMELKDVILSTLAEMDTDIQEESEVSQRNQEAASTTPIETAKKSVPVFDDEKHYLENIRERLLVLFEGFQSPNNSQIEAKVDLTLNFLEYLLATIDTRLDKLK
jgi:hypothetical protein